MSNGSASPATPNQRILPIREQKAGEWGDYCYSVFYAEGCLHCGRPLRFDKENNVGWCEHCQDILYDEFEVPIGPYKEK